MKQVVEDNEIVVLKADMTEFNEEIEQELLDFGNTIKAIPYYAVYRPGKEPHHFDGNFTATGPKGFLETAGIDWMNSQSSVKQVSGSDKQSDSTDRLEPAVLSGQ